MATLIESGTRSHLAKGAAKSLPSTSSTTRAVRNFLVVIHRSFTHAPRPRVPCEPRSMSPRPISRILLAILLPVGIWAAGSGSGSAVVSSPVPQPRWLPPLGVSLDVIAPFRAPVDRYAAGHRGFDLAAVPGAAVAAPASGTVTFAGRVVDRDVVSVRVDAATVVSVEPVTSALSQGDTVAAGDRLGEVSRGGHCDGTCVHLGVRVDDWYVNPMRFFRDKPVLLPWNEAP